MSPLLLFTDRIFVAVGHACFCPCKASMRDGSCVQNAWISVNHYVSEDKVKSFLNVAGPEVFSDKNRQKNDVLVNLRTYVLYAQVNDWTKISQLHYWFALLKRNGDAIDQLYGYLSVLSGISSGDCQFFSSMWIQSIAKTFLLICSIFC